MTKFNLPRGPITTVPRDILTDDDGGFASEDDRYNALQMVLSGIELGEADLGTLRWLSGWETETVGVLCSLFQRVRAQAMGEGEHGRAVAAVRAAQEAGPMSRYGLPSWDQGKPQD